MDDSFIQIFDEAMLYEDMRESVRRFQITDEAELIPFWNDLANRLADFCNGIIASDEAMANRIMNTAYRVSENFHNTALAQGILESELIPIMLEYLSRYRSIEVDDGDWRIAGTPSGFVTMQDMASGQFLHSTSDPMWDAYTLADFMYADGLSDFYFFGCGLGYLPYQMWKVSEESITVHIYEYDPRVVEYARMFGPLDLIAPDRLDIHMEESLDALVERYLELQGTPYQFYTHPSNFIANLFTSLDRRDLPLYLAQYHNHVIARRRYNINVAFNKPHFTQNHLNLPKSFLRDEWIVLAAGPSLDNNISFIKENRDKSTVIGVSTVIRRLAKENIKPDLLIVCDPFNDIMPHLNGFEDFTSDIPLVAHTQTYWQFIEHYRGPIYKIAEAGDEDDINNNYPRWHAGGTVTSLAIELACLSGAKRVYIIGMDLAYPGGRYYADSTSKGARDEAESSLWVRANDGSMVMTAPNFKFYANQVEVQKQYWSEIEFWNLAVQGQYVPMTRTGKWWEEGVGSDTDLHQWFEKLQTDGFLSWRERYYLLRQTVDCEGISLDDLVKKHIEEILAGICDDMLAEQERIRNMHLRRGNNLRVYITDTTPDTVSLEKTLGMRRQNDINTIVINTREKLAGEKVFMKNAIDQEPYEEETDTITVNGMTYPYIRMTGRLTDIEVYEQFIGILAEQNGVDIVNSAPYSLFAEICRKNLS